MKNNLAFRFFVNILVYLFIVLAFYFLYSPLNNHPNNKTGSSAKFVYQQF
jgi:hypothetical protein